MSKPRNAYNTYCLFCTVIEFVQMKPITPKNEMKKKGKNYINRFGGRSAKYNHSLIFLKPHKYHSCIL